VQVHDADKTMQVIVPDDQLSLAIGKRGQNVRLAAKLTHWKIDIKSESEVESGSEHQEALRRAESAFQIPKRTLEAAPPAPSVMPLVTPTPLMPDESTSTAEVSAPTSTDVEAVADPQAPSPVP
jgi:N utilization substance protein A